MKQPFLFLCPEITREHAAHMIRWLRDPEVRKYLSDPRSVSDSLEQTLDRVNLPILTQLFRSHGRFYIVSSRQGEPVGFLRLIANGEETEIVIVIGEKRHWGKRYGAGAIREGMKIAFFEMRSKKVIAKIHRDNLRSLRAFSKAGFRPESDGGDIKCFTMTLGEYIHRITTQPVTDNEIIVTEVDKSRLVKLIEEQMQSLTEPADNIRTLSREVGRASIVQPAVLPDDVISMHTRAILGLDRREIEVSLVYPRDADWKSRKLSVLSPIGTAILGYRESDYLEWDVPSGKTEIHIKKILYQPEAAGDYHL